MAATNSENSGNTLSRRQLMGWLSATGIGTAAFHRALTVQAASATEVTVEMVKQAEWVSGIELTDEQRKETATGLTRTLRDLEALRSYDVGYDTWPALKMHLLPGEQETEARKPLVKTNPTTSLKNVPTMTKIWPSCHYESSMTY